MSTGARLEAPRVETLAQRLFRLQSEVSDYLLDEAAALRGLGPFCRDATKKANGLQESDSNNFGGSEAGSLVEKESKAVSDPVLFGDLSRMIGVRNMEIAVKTSLMEKLQTGYDADDPVRSLMFVERRLHPSADAPKVRPASEVQSDDVVRLEKRVARIESALGMWRNLDEEMPYPDILTGLSDCENMYRHLFLNKKVVGSTVRSTYFEHGVQMIGPLLQLARCFEEDLETKTHSLSVASQFKLRRLHIMLSHMRVLEDVMPLLEQRSARLANFLANGGAVGTSSQSIHSRGPTKGREQRVDACENRVTTLEKSATALGKQLTTAVDEIRNVVRGEDGGAFGNSWRKKNLLSTIVSTLHA